MKKEKLGTIPTKTQYNPVEPSQTQGQLGETLLRERGAQRSATESASTESEAAKAPTPIRSDDDADADAAAHDDADDDDDDEWLFTLAGPSLTLHPH